MDDKEAQLAISKYLLQKYSDIINEREQRTIGEIKNLVDGTDLSVQTLVSEFKEEHFDFKENYFVALKKTFEFVKEKIKYLETDMGINYWLTAKEILEIKIADDEDMAVFLCNCMKALGDDKAEVIIAELEDLHTHAFVSTTQKDNFIILDPAQKHSFEEFVGTKTEVIRKYSYKKQKIKRFLYRFNSEKYEQFLE